jgi:hypothetical protein
MATTRKTVRVKAVPVDAKKPKVDTTRRRKAKEAEAAATAREEERAKTYVSRSSFRKLAAQVRDMNVLLEALHRDVCETELEVQQLQQATMWQTVRTFFGRKVW